MPPRPSDLLPDDPDFEGTARRVLEQGARLVGASATTTYMREGSPDAGRNQQIGRGSLRRASGDLARSLTGARSAGASGMRGAPTTVFDLSPTSNGVRLEYGSAEEHAATHEFGDRRAVTPRQESFFWHRFQETGEERWKAMALSETLTYPERPYLRPALDDALPRIVDIAEEEFAGAIVGVETTGDRLPIRTRRPPLRG